MSSKMKLLEAALFTPMAGGEWGLPIVIYSEPGMAKTSIWRQLSRKYAFPFERLAPGARGEGAFGVTPCPQPIDGLTVMTYPPPDWALKFKDGGVVFVDEINTLPAAIAPAGLDLVQERTIGSYKFGPRTRVVGAANPAASAANAIEFSAAQANRMGHMDWPAPDLNAWVNHQLGSSDAVKPIDPVKLEGQIMKRWPAEWAKAIGALSGFLKRRPEFQHRKPGADDPNVSRAWPSLRTLEYAGRAMAVSPLFDLTEDEQRDLVGSFIGGGASRELHTWLSEADLPDPELLLDGKLHYEPTPQRLDRTIAVLGTAAATVRNTTGDRRKARAEVLWRLIGTVAQDAKDVVLPAVSVLINSKLGGKEIVGAMDAKIMLYDLVEATGITWRDFE